MTHEVAQWMMRHSYATGHGDTLDDLLGELVHQVHANALLEAHKAAATTGSPTDDARLADELEHLAAQLPPSSSKDACMEAAKIVTGMPTDDARALADQLKELDRHHAESDLSAQVLGKGVKPLLKKLINALRRTAPVAGRDRGVRKAVESAIRNLVSSRDDLGYTHFLEIRDAVFAALPIHRARRGGVDGRENRILG